MKGVFGNWTWFVLILHNSAWENTPVPSVSLYTSILGSKKGRKNVAFRFQICSTLSPQRLNESPPNLEHNILAGIPTYSVNFTRICTAVLEKTLRNPLFGAISVSYCLAFQILKQTRTSNSWNIMVVPERCLKRPNMCFLAGMDVEMVPHPTDTFKNNTSMLFSSCFHDFTHIAASRTKIKICKQTEIQVVSAFS